MEEIINGINNKDKEVFEVSKHLADYLIEKNQTEENSEYIGKVSAFERLQEAGNLAEYLKANEENKNIVIEKLKQDLNKIEPVKENAYYYCKVLNLIIEVNNLEPLINRKIDIVDETKENYKKEFSFYLGKTTNITNDMEIEEFAKLVDSLVDEFMELEQADYQEFLEEKIEELENHEEEDLEQ